MTSHNHYFIDVSGLDRVDVYRVMELAGITCPVAQHVFKKAWAAGRRGHKSLERDWQDIRDSAARKLQMLSEDAGRAHAGRQAFVEREELTYGEHLAARQADQYQGEGGVMIRCPDCSAEHCACVAG